MFPRVETILKREKCTTKINEGLYGSIQRSCTQEGNSCAQPCVAIKTTKAGPNAIESKLQRDILVHEATMLQTLHALEDREVHAHVEKFVQTILDESPSMVSEQVQGLTLASAAIAKSFLVKSILANLFVQTCFVLYSIRQLVPNFTHGDLHANNIFVVQRTAMSHCQKDAECKEMCKFTFFANDDIQTIVMNDPQMIKLIDFGMSQSKQLRTENEIGQDHWKADCFMALSAFWGISDAANRALFEAFAIDQFGPSALAVLKDTEVDIPRVIPKDGLFEDFLQHACQFFQV